MKSLNTSENLVPHYRAILKGSKAAYWVSENLFTDEESAREMYGTAFIRLATEHAGIMLPKKDLSTGQ